MDRLVLIIVLFATGLSTRVCAQVSSYEELARAMEEDNWRGALSATRALVRNESAHTPLEQAVQCMHVLLLEMQLRDHLAHSPEGVAEISRTLRGVDESMERLVAAMPHCPSDVLALDPNRAAELAYLRPRIERARQLTEGAVESGDASAELEQVFASEHAEIVAAVPDGPDNDWARVRALWEAQDTPEARSRDWPWQSEAPMIGTGVLFLGFGLVSFMSTLTALSGSGLPSLSAGGWGITFALLPAMAAAWTWEQPKRGLLITSMAFTALAAAGGAAAIGRLNRDGRYFGRGLLIGSGLSVLWQIGGWIHRRYPERARREWRERLRVSPTAGRRFGGLVAEGRF